MNLNRWTILAVILLLSTAVGIIFVPIGGWWPEPSPLMYVGLGLTILQTIFLLTVVLTTIAATIILKIRPGDHIKEGLHPLRTAFIIVTERIVLRFNKGRIYTSSEYTIIGYRTVSILWWTYFMQFGLVVIVHIIYLLAISLNTDNIFPPAFGLVFTIPFLLGILTALYFVHTTAYVDRVSNVWSDDFANGLKIGASEEDLQLTPLVVAAITGLIVAIPLNYLYGFFWLLGEG